MIFNAFFMSVEMVKGVFGSLVGSGPSLSETVTSLPAPFDSPLSEPEDSSLLERTNSFISKGPEISASDVAGPDK